VTVSAYTLGCFFGALTTIFIGNGLGRRRAIFLGSSIMIVGAAIMCASVKLPMFVVARVITGYVQMQVHGDVANVSDLVMVSIRPRFRLGNPNVPRRIAAE
jgi:predicted MFS family arabinose efflux permease